MFCTRTNFFLTHPQDAFTAPVLGSGFQGVKPDLHPPIPLGDLELMVFQGERPPYQRLFTRPHFQADGRPEMGPSSLNVPRSDEGLGQPHLPALAQPVCLLLQELHLLENSQELPAEPKPQEEFCHGAHTPAGSQGGMLPVWKVFPVQASAEPPVNLALVHVCPGGALPFPPLCHDSPCSLLLPLSPRTGHLNLHTVAATGEQAFRETAAEKIIPFSLSNASLKQRSEGCADSGSLP